MINFAMDTTTTAQMMIVRRDGIALRSNEAVATMESISSPNGLRPNTQHHTHTSMPTSKPTDKACGHKPSRDNCDRRRPDEEDISRLPNMSQQAASQTMTPFLREHIPGLYAPTSKPDVTRTKDPNSKFCYRHRPDSKCRRAADESKMALIQSELERLPQADQQAITHVWSLFSAAPGRHRELMLKGVMTQCCFPQLSMVSREVSEQLKIDFLSALPAELSMKILCFLDCVSLCKAAQVSRRWRSLADDDQVWHHMCKQHIDRKCTRCGWGLPRLETKRLRDWKKQMNSQTNQDQLIRVQEITSVATETDKSGTRKRDAPELNDDENSRAKRPCMSKESSSTPPCERKFRPWKDVYKDRFMVGSNWKYGRCSIKIFRGEHTNGITCLQFDDSMLATGSYDNTIKLWNMETCDVIRTLKGHTSGIRALQFDSRVLVSGSLDGTVKIWNWRTGDCLNTLSHQGGVITVHMDGDYLASGSMDKHIKIFNFKTLQSFCLRGHCDWVNQVRIDAESRTVFSASDDCTVKLWDLDSKTCIRTYDGHVGQVQQVLPLPDDFEFEDETTGEADAASVTSNRSGTPCAGADSIAAPQLPTLVDDERSAYGYAFKQDKDRHLPPRYMLTGSLDSTMRLWDTTTGKYLRTWFGHVEGIWGLAADSLRYVTGANDATVKIWDPKSSRCERTFTGHEGPVTCVGLSDSRMASGGEDGEVRLYKFDSASSEVVERGTPA